MRRAQVFAHDTDIHDPLEMLPHYHPDRLTAHVGRAGKRSNNRMLRSLARFRNAESAFDPAANHCEELDTHENALTARPGSEGILDEP
jgi:hypothetical protein